MKTRELFETIGNVKGTVEGAGKMTRDFRFMILGFVLVVLSSLLLLISFTLALGFYLSYLGLGLLPSIILSCLVSGVLFSILGFVIFKKSLSQVKKSYKNIEGRFR